MFSLFPVTEPFLQ